jgi:hypothetical protein
MTAHRSSMGCAMTDRAQTAAMIEDIGPWPEATVAMFEDLGLAEDEIARHLRIEPATVRQLRARAAAPEALPPWLDPPSEPSPGGTPPQDPPLDPPRDPPNTPPRGRCWARLWGFVTQLWRR